MNLCSYFGNRYLSHLEKDLDEIKSQGFDAVVLPINEQDYLYHSSNMIDMIRAIQSRNLCCWVDPVGMGNVFGYGSISDFLGSFPDQRMVNQFSVPQKHVCPGSRDFKTYLISWILMFSMADGILWDEPNFSPCFCDKCKGYIPMLELMDHCTDVARRRGMFNSVCYYGTNVKYIGAPLFDDVGVSLTVEKLFEPGYCDKIIDDLSRIKIGLTTSVWIPSYSIPTGKEKETANIAKWAFKKGIDNIATWGYRGCEASSYCTSDSPSDIWKEMGLVFKEIASNTTHR